MALTIKKTQKVKPVQIGAADARTFETIPPPPSMPEAGPTMAVAPGKSGPARGPAAGSRRKKPHWATYAVFGIFTLIIFCSLLVVQYMEWDYYWAPATGFPVLKPIAPDPAIVPTHFSGKWLYLLSIQTLPILLTILYTSIILFIISLTITWDLMKKAGQQAWSVFVPVYSGTVWLRMASLPAWMTVLLLIPGINLFVWVFGLHRISRNFGKGMGFTVGLIILPFVFYPILAYGKDPFAPPKPEEPVQEETKALPEAAPATETAAQPAQEPAAETKPAPTAGESQTAPAADAATKTAEPAATAATATVKKSAAPDAATGPKTFKIKPKTIKTLRPPPAEEKP